MTKNIILLDTDNYKEDFSQDEMLENLQLILEDNVKTPRGEVVSLILSLHRSSRYGSISNNGMSGYKDLNTDKLDTNIIFISQRVERAVIENNNGALQITYHDHDGETTCLVKYVPKSKKYQYENLESLTFNERLTFIDKLSSIKIEQ